jgi:hypothetical protein
MLNILKLKFEGNNKIYEFCVTDNNTHFNDQQRNFIEKSDHDPESKHFHHLFNPETKEFVLSVEEIKASNSFIINFR